MDRGNSERVFTLAVLFLILAFSWAQDKKYDSFAWRPMKLQRPSSILPYQPEATTTSYDSRFFDNSAPFQGSTRFYPDSPSPFSGGPDSYSMDSYSPDFPKSQPYHYPEDSGSYEQYGPTRDDNFNITMERYGGFGGTGDTRGYGAYDYPKKVHDDVPQELHPEEPKIGTRFPDLLRLGRDRFHHERNPLHMHPLPPPL